jgi:hypothetical protein
LVVLETPESALVLLDGHSVCPAFNPISDRQKGLSFLTVLAIRSYREHLVRAHNQTLLSRFFRCWLISALSISGVTMLAAIGPEAFTRNIVLASKGVEREVRAVQPSGSAYPWNLGDDGSPLITLPDHISGSLDQSLTYSMGQFEFPLFQTLYYNQRARKYILMVTRKDEPVPQADGIAGRPMSRHAEFIELAQIGDSSQFAASGKLSLRLETKGGARVLTTSDATVFSFAALADGELHCRQINDRHGAVIHFKYSNEASLESISDDRGRTISFSYTDQYVSSVAQTWGGNAKRLSKSWAIEAEVRYAHAVAAPTRSNFASPASAPASTLAKHVPSNAIKATYTRAMAASDSALAAMFGGPGAIAAANGYEPAGLGHQYPLYRGDLVADDGRILRGHLSFAMHLYGSADGASETELYIPLGFTSHSEGPSPTDAVMTFYYPRLGNLSDVTLAVFHIRNFQLSYEGERVRIGSIGGPGGSAASYRHSHLEFYHGNTGLPPLATRVQLRIDPATVLTSTIAMN